MLPSRVLFQAEKDKRIVLFIQVPVDLFAKHIALLFLNGGRLKSMDQIQHVVINIWSLGHPEFI